MEQTLIFQHMRYIILFMCLMACTLSSVSQNLNLKSLKWWNPGYPTVVDAGIIDMRSGAVNNRYGLLTDSQIAATKKIPGMEDFAISAGAYDIYLMWTLKAIDGIDYKALSDEQISQFFNNTGSHKFSWETPYEKEHITIGLPSKKYEFVKTLNIDYDKGDDKAVPVEQYFQKKEGYDVLVDWDVDWSKIRTYDFLLRGNDPLTDKKILEEFAKSFEGIMTRDTESPDVFFTIAKDSESSVSYSYVPPKVDYIKTGSTTRKVYNWVGQNPRYSTEDHYQKVESQGYTKEINHSEIFLEICMLDASKIEQSTPPIIYKGTIKKIYPTKINALDNYLLFAGLFGHPINQKLALKELRFDESIPYTLRWGIKTYHGIDYKATKSNPNKILMIYEPSLRVLSGTTPAAGDLIIKYESENSRYYNDMSVTQLKYYTTDGETRKVKIVNYAKPGVPNYWREEIWFRPYLMTVEE